VIVALANGTISCWDIRSRTSFKPSPTIQILPSSTNPKIDCWTVAPLSGIAGWHVAGGYSDSLLRLFDLRATSQNVVQHKFDGGITSINHLPQTQQTLVTTLGGSVGVFHEKEVDHVLTQKAHSSAWCGRFLPHDPTRLVTSGEHGDIKLWSTKQNTMETLSTIYPAQSSIILMEFFPSRPGLLLTTSLDQCVRCVAVT